MGKEVGLVLRFLCDSDEKILDYFSVQCKIYFFFYHVAHIPSCLEGA